MPDMLQINIYRNESPWVGDRALLVLRELAALGAEFRIFGPGSEYDPAQRYFEGPIRDFFPFELGGASHTLTFVEETADQMHSIQMAVSLDSGERQVAARTLQMTERLLPLCDARFAFVDYLGFDDPPAQALAAGEIPMLFWANFFGPAAVERWGRELLLGAPGWKKAELAGGTIEYVLTEEPGTPPDPAFDAEVRAYFAPRAQVKRYVALPLG
jgi:hypothetical protein